MAEPEQQTSREASRSRPDGVGSCCSPTWPASTSRRGRELGVTGRWPNIRGGVGSRPARVQPEGPRGERSDRAGEPGSAGPIVRRAGRKRRRGRLVGAAVAVAVALGRGVHLPADRTTPRPATGDLRDAGGKSRLAQAPTGRDLLDSDQIRRLGVSRSGTSPRPATTPTATASTRCASRPVRGPGRVRRRSCGRSPPPVHPDARPCRPSRSPSPCSGRGRYGTDARLVRRLPARPAPAPRLLPGRRHRRRADVLVVRIWSKPVTTVSVAVARTGR